MRGGGRRHIARRAAATVAAAGLIAAGLVTFAGPASAGGPVYDVTKTVVGTAPGGTQFQVAYSCTNQSPPISGTFTFGATGGTQSLQPNTTVSTCSVNETATGGAVSVAYHCDNHGHVIVTCSADGKSETTTSNAGIAAPAATLTVTNDFTPPITLAPAPPPIVAAPAFTG
jgi:Domain of unknown function (DUF5979)